MLSLQPINAKQALNKSYLKDKISRNQIELFKKNLTILFNSIYRKGDEENLKTQITYFLRDTWYKETHQINPIDKNDLVIHTGNSANDAIGVIIELKSITNRAEMISVAKPNAKALHELILYYLRARIDKNNNEIKYLIVTNVEDWFLFDANEFDKKIYRNLSIKKLYDLKRSDHKDNPFFYEEINKILDQSNITLEVTKFEINEFKEYFTEANVINELKLIPLYKLLSPVHLLKLPFGNDSNTLNTKFYSELLHLIGLEEYKEGSKKLIKQKEHSEIASLIENTIIKLEDNDCLSRLTKPSIFGSDKKTRIFNIALELCITWINRLLFLKLLEAQLLNYHKKNNEYSFLNNKTILDYDELNNLFFQVLAERPMERRKFLKEKFSKVPYLNSSLFERTELEKETIDISALNNRLEISIYDHSILKGGSQWKNTERLPTLEYLLRFLDSYDFTSEGPQEIQEETKHLINASVLGLIFEKINGYKEGSFFTPGTVTMYMCRETIRRAVLNKFNEHYKLDCADFVELKNFLSSRFKPNDILEFNSIINKLRICDPAVGSGHFLVSALNELIAIKAELNLLADKNGELISGYEVKVGNDELIITYNNNTELFEYSVTGNSVNSKIQHVQKTLFHEKENLIENCLFGVDSNHNSVKICRLRLWIELLKHTYYTEESHYSELETLPNIDINIKCNNSLISRFSQNSSLGDALKNVKGGIKTYKKLIKDYMSATNKDEKMGLENLIKKIKKDFVTHIGRDNTEQTKLNKLIDENNRKYYSAKLFEDNLTEEQKKDKEKLSNEISAQKRKISDIKLNWIFENSFEWRFEFPEILDDEGKFSGFDVIIGNPPYGTFVQEKEKKYFKENYTATQGPFELYKFFIERGVKLLNENGLLCYISPDTWKNLSYFKKLRSYLANNFSFQIISVTLYDVFDEATVDTNIYIIKNSLPVDSSFRIVNSNLEYEGVGQIIKIEDDAIIALKPKPKIVNEIENDSFQLDQIIEVWRGMSAYGVKNIEKPYNTYTKNSELHRALLNGGDIAKYAIKWKGEFIEYGSWLHRPRPAFIYDNPHLLVQRIRNPRLKDRIVATYDDQKFISSDGLSNLLLKDKSDDFKTLKALLAILNSKTINYWFSFYYFDVNIKPEQLRKIPIKNSFKQVIPLLSIVVDYILILSKANQDFAFFERLIDAIIYELYFPDSIRTAEANVTPFLQSLTELDNQEESIKEIGFIYKKLTNPSHPISSALLKLINVGEVAIIEGRNEKNNFNTIK